MSQTVKVNCHTNLDGYETTSWPVVVSCKPAVGERIAGDGGKSLRIVGITHAMRQLTRDMSEAYLIIELNK
jgi:hypothetical protein